MNKLFQIIFLILFIAGEAFSEESLPKSFWNLPKKVSTQNTEVSFLLDSTWHDTSFKVNQVDGNVWLGDPKDFKSLKAKIAMPVSRFDSENETRDEKMRDVMAADLFPEVIFELSKVDGLPDPKDMVEGKSYPITINGDLKIRDFRKAIEIKSSIKKTNDNFDIAGDVVIDWSEYGVEDPSIIIAKVYKDLKVTFKMSL